MKKMAMLTLLAGTTGFVVFPALSQPDLKRGGLGTEKAENGDKARQKEDEARKAAANIAVAEGARKATFQRDGQMSEERVRRELQAQGINDENTQNAILEHVRRVEEARKAVDEKSVALRANLKPNTAMADAQFNVLFNDYQAAIEDYRIVREKSAAQLDEKIGYSKKPRLHATLMTLGLIGDAPSTGNSTLGGNTFEFLNRRLGEPPVIMRWNDGANGNGQFQFDFNGAPPPNAVPFGVPVPDPNGNIIIEKAFRAFGEARNGGEPFGAMPNPFIQANPVLNPDQITALRREFGAQIKELREEMNRLRAAQGEKAQGEKREKTFDEKKERGERSEKGERAEKGEKF